MRVIGVIGVVLLAGAPQDLKGRFEAKRALDPLAAFRMLADDPSAAAPFARAALAKQLTEDLTAGLKAYEAGQTENADRFLTRAALMSEPYAPELSRELVRWILLLKGSHKTLAECAPCKNAGATPCSACQAGLALRPCTRCEAKGSVACVLCDGSGTLDHQGYKGTLVLKVERDTRVTFKGDAGKTLRGTLNAQTLTYQMQRCSGGSFGLQTESLVAKTGEKKTGSTSQTCSKFWSEMKMFAFSGRAKIQVDSPKGALAPVSPAMARRFFSEYESCAAGRVPCDRCAGRKSDPCSLCAGKGQALLSCGICDGAAAVPCSACRGVGESSWLARAVPPAQAAALADALRKNAALLRDFMLARSARASRKADLARRLEDARKGADGGAKFAGEAGVVEVQCPRCKGAGGDCEECWGAGRREYAEGGAVYERYALIDRLARRVAEAAKAAPFPAPLPLPEDEAVLAKTPPPPPPPPGPLVVPGGPPVAIPTTVDEMIRKADQLYESGKGHLEKSKASTDNTVWISEGLLAVKDLRDAQILLTSAQEKLDELGQPVPKTLQDRYRTNLQALVMARKQVP